MIKGSLDLSLIDIHLPGGLNESTYARHKYYSKTNAMLPRLPRNVHKGQYEKEQESLLEAVKPVSCEGGSRGREYPLGAQIS